MSDENTLALLEQTQKKLHLILTIDEFRDSSPNPAAMMSAIVNLLSDEFKADLCLMVLIDRVTGELELKAVNEHDKLLQKLGIEKVRQLAARASESDTIQVWKGDKVFSELDIENPPKDMEIAAVPIILGPQERLGALLIFRAGKPFKRAETDIINAAESQIDSAIIQGYAYYDLQQRNKELETIYRVDRIRDQSLLFDEMLNAVLHELRDAIQAEMGFIMLYERPGNKLELRAVTHDDLFGVGPYHDAIEKMAYRALEEAGLVYDNEIGDKTRAVMCIPLILREEILGVFGVVNPYGPGGFDEEDRRLLNAIASQMDTAIFESLEQRRLKQVLGRSVDPRVMQRLLANPDVGFLQGERSFLTVLYADLRGSTSLAERTEPEMLVEFINDYLGKMSEVVLKHEGTLDKFVGDEVMALFGAPFKLEDHALRAVRVGLEMQIAHKSILSTWKEKGVKEAPIGVGIASGELIVGEMGSAQRTDYTVIGPAANLGSRICSVAQGGQVLISQATYNLVKDQVVAEPISGLEMKGVSGLITVYDVKRTLD